MDALSYTLRLLKTRLRSEWEIDQALLRRGVEPDARHQTIATLKESGLINDQRFARAWVHTRDLLSPRGKIVLRQELLQKGIDPQLITEVLAERAQLAQEEDDDQPTELELAQDLARRKESSYARLDPKTRERRLGAFLTRRGFSYDVIKRILNT